MSQASYTESRTVPDLAIDALEMAAFNRRRADEDLDQLVHHSDMGVRYLSIRHSQRAGSPDRKL